MNGTRLSWLIVPIMALVLLVAAACGSNSPSQASGPTATTPPTPTQSTPSTSASPTATQAAAPTPTSSTPYFQGKTIRLVVTSSPGGGTDTQARYLAAKWGQFIPGHPRITVSNIRRTAGTNYAWNAKPDGTTILFQANSNISRADTDPQSQMDISKVQYIAGWTSRVPALMVFDSVPYKTINDAMGKTQPVIRYPAEAPNANSISSTDLSVMAMATYLNVPMKFVAVAAASTSDVLLMYQRGEADAMAKGGLWQELPGLDPGWESQGKVNCFAVLGLAGAKVGASPEAPCNAPSVGDLVPASDKALWDALAGPDTVVGKNIWVPPDTPASVVQILRNAAQQAVQDQTFAAGYAKIAGEAVDFTPGAQLQTEMEQTNTAFLQQKDNVTAFQQQMFNQWFK